LSLQQLQKGVDMEAAVTSALVIAVSKY
jgi:hypothetical protein